MTTADDRNAQMAQRARDAGYRVRGMRLEDAARIGEVHVQTWREAYVALMSEGYLAGLDVETFTAAWRERLAGKPADLMQLVGVNPSGQLVGIAVAGPSRDEDALTGWELWMINILASEQGTGLADLMMAELVGDRAASLWVLDGNERAQAFYLRYGFLADGASKHDPPTGAIEVRLVRSSSATSPAP